MSGNVSVNQLVTPLIKQLVENADAYRVGVKKMQCGATLIDAGVNSLGSIETGRMISEICMGGLGQVQITHSMLATHWPLMVNVTTSNPVLACLASQYAGWSLNHGEGKTAFSALGSGPGRAAALKDPVSKELGYSDRSGPACFVLEVDSEPPEELVQKMAEDCQTSADQLTLILTPTRSMAGATQVVARVLEVALHKTHEIGFSLDNVVDGSGSAPFSPPAPDFLSAMGRTNDAILFAGRVHLFVNGADDDAEQLANQLPSSTSKDYGKPFGQVFKDYKYNFFDIDPMLFSPAQVVVTAMESGKSFHAGKIDLELLEASFSS